MTTTYSVNREAAIKASGVPRILTKGAYVGTFTRAEAITSSMGTTGIDFSFVTDDGATADFLTIWTINAKGEDLSGRNLVSALMTCMAVRDITMRRARIEKYNADTRARELMDADIFPELMGKPIGLLLILEEYVSNAGAVKSKLVIVGAFDPVTGKTAKEIWEKAPAHDLPALTAALRDRPLPPDKQPGMANASRTVARRDEAFAFPGDDSIPF